MVLRYGLALILAGLWMTTGFFSLYGLFNLLYLVFFIMWIIGFIGAVNGEQKPIPLIGDMAQKMFPGI
jgi:uncharacterized membrane protein